MVGRDQEFTPSGLGVEESTRKIEHREPFQMSENYPNSGQKRPTLVKGYMPGVDRFVGAQAIYLSVRRILISHKEEAGESVKPEKRSVALQFRRPT